MLPVATATAYFSPPLFDFLRQLRQHNDRDWFQKNKSRYESDVRDPALRFIEAVGPGLRKISPHLVADPRPIGGSLFRINRDIRFSKDKSPYKTAVGISFGHDQGRERAAPGLYLHVEPGESFTGGGLHILDGPALARVRDAIVADPGAWRKVVEDPKFKDAARSRGESLKRAPQGYDPNHPLVDELRRKSFTWHMMFTEAQVCRPDFAGAFLDACRAANPFDRFLAGAVGVDW